MPPLIDSGTERAVLSGMMVHGADLLLDIEGILDTKDFYSSSSQKLFTVLKHLVHEKGIKQFDIPTVMTTAKLMGYEDFIGRNREEEFLQALMEQESIPSNIESLAGVLCKLSILRKCSSCVKNIREKLWTMNGNEPLDDILGAVQDPVFELTSKLFTDEDAMSNIARDFDETIDAILKEPQKLVGLPTGFPKWDASIGGGLRPGTVNVVGARPKLGKSYWCLNVAYNVAKAGTPVLYLDTELTKQYQMMRLIARHTGVDINSIETGQFSENKECLDSVMGSGDFLKSLPITHCNIAGKSLKSIFSMAKRWLVKHVGLDDDGRAKPCLIVYDYLKLMDSADIKGNMQEHQLLGFLISSMHNFAIDFNLPVLATVQLNRDGVEKEGGQVISGSDRILWLCSSFTILKHKLKVELAEDPPSNGKHKLIVTDTRFGPGMSPGEYINLKCRYEISEMVEGPSFSQVMTGGVSVNEEI